MKIISEDQRIKGKSALKTNALKMVDSSSDLTETMSDHILSTPSSSDADENDVNTIDNDEPARVRFEQIEIRNYDMILGDNPSCSYGPPVTLDWDYSKNKPMSLDEYEKRRGQRRKTYQMQIPAVHRRRILEQSGYTPDEIEYMCKEMNTIKSQRERTKMMLPFSKLQEAAESAKRKKKRAQAAKNSTGDKDQ